MGAGLEVVADVLEEGKQAAAGIADGGHALAPAGHAGNAAHGVSPLYAISIVALAQALFMFSLWVISTRTTRAEASQGGLALLRLACVALGRLAVWLGAALPWACCCCRSGRPLPSSTTIWVQALRRGVCGAVAVYAAKATSMSRARLSGLSCGA